MKLDINVAYQTKRNSLQLKSILIIQKDMKKYLIFRCTGTHFHFYCVKLLHLLSSAEI